MRFSYPEFFEIATDHKPYLWQCRLACGEPPDRANCDLEAPDKLTLEWLSGGTDCNSKLIDIPTGLGKTAGVVLAWLWNRLRVVELSANGTEQSGDQMQARSDERGVENEGG